MEHRIRLFNRLTNRTIDPNGFLKVAESPILKAGVLKYAGRELVGNTPKRIDGVLVEPDEIYSVNLSEDEMRKGANSFAMMPIQLEHQWLGKEGKDSKNRQEGSLGENWKIKNGMLYYPMTITGGQCIDGIKNHDYEELSASYDIELKKSDKAGVDFEAYNLKGNHVALVNRGRCGHDVRVLNTGEIVMNTRIENAKLQLLVNDEVYDLSDALVKNAEGKKDDGEDKAVDNRCMKNEDDEDNEEFTIEEIKKEEPSKEEGDAEKAKNVENDGEMDGDDDDDMPTQIIDDDDEGEENKENKEPSKDDENKKVENDDKRKLIDEIGGMLKGKVDEEVWRTIIGKVERAAYSKSEDSEEASKVRAENSAKMRAYNDVKGFTGDFDFDGMTSKQIYQKGLAELGYDVKGSEPELRGAFLLAKKAHRVDNEYQLSNSSSNMTEEEFNF